jgi:hypothetical protein
VDILAFPEIGPGSPSAEDAETETAELAASLRSGPAGSFLSRHVDVETFLSASGSGRKGADILRVVRSGRAMGRFRRDFVRTWPAVAIFLLDPSFASSVDSGAPTVPIVASSLAVPRSIARRVTALPRPPASPRNELEGHRPHRSLGEIMAAIGNDRLPGPGDRSEGEAFCQCLDLLTAILETAGCTQGRVNPKHAARMLAGIPGSTWRGRRDRLGPATDASSGDLIWGLGEWLHALGHSESDPLTAFAMLAGHSGLTDILAASDRWHATPALAEWSADVPPEAEWPIPFDEVDLGDGWSARALGSLAELQAEGMDGVDSDGRQGLSHCVAGYAVQALTSRSLIVSIRHGEGTGPSRVSTAELEPEEGGDWTLAGRPYALSQHRGRRNSDPPGGAVAAIAALRRKLSGGEVRIEAGALDERSPPERDDEGPSREAALAVIDLWRPLLPRRLARLDAHGLLHEAARIQFDVGGDEPCHGGASIPMEGRHP